MEQIFENPFLNKEKVYLNSYAENNKFDTDKEAIKNENQGGYLQEE